MSFHRQPSLATWAIRNPVPPLVFFLVLTITGIVAFMNLPITNMPAVVSPLISVQIKQSGASATDIDAQITRRVENAIAGIQGVKHIESTSSEGLSLNQVIFHLGTNADRALIDVREAIASVRDQLPKSIIEPQIKRIEIDGGAILIYSLEAFEMQQEEESWFIDNTLFRELLKIPGVARVERHGGVMHEITLNLDAQRLAAYGVSAATVSRELARTNINLPSGRIIVAGSEYLLRTLGSANTIELLKDTRITLGNQREIKLSDLGTLSKGGAEQRSISRLNGKPAVTFQIFRSQGSSEVTVASKVQETLNNIMIATPSMKFKQIFSLVTLTENTFKATVWSFFEGVALTMLVVFLFIRDKRATAITTIAIPLSIIPTFLCFSLLGFTLNTLSMLGITLVIGVVVDDAIVEIENIHRHMREGKKPYNAALVAVNEIGQAVIATTLVICAVFIPVSFMDDLPGQFFKQFGLAVAISAFFSLLVARLLIPMLAAYLMKTPSQVQRKPNIYIEKYYVFVEWTLTHRLKTMGFAALSMILSFSIIPLLSIDFIPHEDYSQSRIAIELPSGSTLEQTDAAAQRVAAILKPHKEVQYILTTVQEGAINKASIEVKLVPRNQRNLDQRTFEQVVLPELKQLPDMRIHFTNPNGKKDVSIMLVSDEKEVLMNTAIAVEREMRTITGLSSVSTTASLKQPEMIITPDFAKAAMLGIHVQTISEVINSATIGDIDVNLAKFNDGDRQIPIRIRLPKNTTQSISTIGNLTLPTNKGVSVPLSAIATITFNSGLTSIERYDRQYKISLEANLNGMTLGTAIHAIYNLPSIKKLPQTVSVQKYGDTEIMEELFAGFWKVIGAGLLMVYAIQVILYKDWIQPFTRMAAIPLSIGGAFIMLLITGIDLSMPTLIGILMLIGIVDKNSILLVDCMLSLIRRGMPKREAILRACRVRAVPIIMTSLAMIAGMIPVALFDTSFRAPMAIAVIGGLISSTALSLIFVPVMFSYVRDFEEWLFPKLRKIIIDAPSRLDEIGTQDQAI